MAEWGVYVPRELEKQWFPTIIVVQYGVRAEEACLSLPPPLSWQSPIEKRSNLFMLGRGIVRWWLGPRKFEGFLVTHVLQLQQLITIKFSE